MSRLFAALFAQGATIFAIDGFGPRDALAGLCVGIAVWCALDWVRPSPKDPRP